jgi:hypothetical protein
MGPISRKDQSYQLTVLITAIKSFIGLVFAGNRTHFLIFPPSLVSLSSEPPHCYHPILQHFLSPQTRRLIQLLLYCFQRLTAHSVWDEMTFILRKQKHARES